MTERPIAAAATVLVVEDEPDVRTVARLMLRRAGYDVVEAANGREAVGLVEDRGEEIDVVLLDIMMPVMDGHEALFELRARVPSLPVVFVSGYDRNEVAAHLDGPDAYTTFLAKPFSKRDLVGEVERALEHQAERNG